MAAWIVFEGSTETGYQGDIAIDDINIHDGPCPVDAQIKPVSVPDINIVSLANNQTALKSIKKRRRKLLRHFRRRNGTRHGE
uniref:MAM domain-containing protein n=1 Tax=Octopus bimaculoides TaxID=37653 RepID=A0A0L8HHN1_OCTBM